MNTPGAGRLTASQAAQCILDRLDRGERAISALVTEGDGRILGARSVFFEGGASGSLGSRELDRLASEGARTLFSRGESEGTREVRFELGDAHAVLYFELHAPKPQMVIVGAGHIAQPLCRVGAMLGFFVEVLDDRPEFAARDRFPEARAVRTIDFRDPFAETALRPTSHVILVTRGHSFDYECLIRILRMREPPIYVGMIGSRRRVRATHEQLVADGFTLDQIRSVRAPVGLDLGGQTPSEIAISVAAEIVQLRSGGAGIPLSEKERIVDRFFADGETETDG
ncbi:MAG: XdhC family protein [Longimicrobiales bacterium]